MAPSVWSEADEPVPPTAVMVLNVWIEQLGAPLTFRATATSRMDVVHGESVSSTFSSVENVLAHTEEWLRAVLREGGITTRGEGADTE